MLNRHFCYGSTYFSPFYYIDCASLSSGCWKYWWWFCCRYLNDMCRMPPMQYHPPWLYFSVGRAKIRVGITSHSIWFSRSSFGPGATYVWCIGWKNNRKDYRQMNSPSSGRTVHKKSSRIRSRGQSTRVFILFFHSSLDDDCGWEAEARPTVLSWMIDCWLLRATNDDSSIVSRNSGYEEIASYSVHLKRLLEIPRVFQTFDGCWSFSWDGRGNKSILVTLIDRRMNEQAHLDRGCLLTCDLPH